MVLKTSSYDRKRKGTSLRKTPYNPTHIRWSSINNDDFVDIKNKRNIELDERVSKNNYESITGNLIEDAILKKILVFDNRLVTVKSNIYAITKLQAVAIGNYEKLDR